MVPVFTLESFDSIYACWQNLHDGLQTSSIFSSPSWSRVWWQHFGSGAKLFLGAIRNKGEVVGIAPLLVRDKTASFIGSEDVCDYLDFVVAPGQGTFFFKVVLDSLAKEGITQVELAPLRPDSAALTLLVDIAPKQGWQVKYSRKDVSVLLNLPATWEAFMHFLGAKQRHELKRKLRRLSEEGEINYRINTEGNANDLNIFFKLFRDCSDDKASFLTPRMESFFRSVVITLAKQKLLRMGVLELNKSPVASTLCFNNKNDVYLYNSGYNPNYSRLSVGFISKALCIKDSIESGRENFDFLKGGEEYKYHLGGHDLPLYNCSLKLVA